MKDNFDLCGLRTSIGSLSYYQLYPPSKKTAEAVEKLISMGADVVGKLSMSAFALMEHPMQSVDYQAPINPRGDDYQIPGGSSSGAGAAIASCEWLDLALVTDSKFTLSYASKIYYLKPGNTISSHRKRAHSSSLQWMLWPTTQLGHNTNDKYQNSLPGVRHAGADGT